MNRFSGMMHLATAILAVALTLASCAGCKQMRTKAILDTSAELIDTSNEVLKTLKSVRDPATAQAALPTLKDKYPLLFTMIRDIADRAKAADRAGGGSKTDVETLKKRMVEFQAIGKKISAENERIRRIRDIPIEFWNFMRSVSIKGLVALSSIGTGQFPPELVSYVTQAESMMEEFGPEHVVNIEAPGLSSARLAEVSSQLQQKLGPSARVAHVAAGGEVSLLVGPVDDFEKFVVSIDFGTVSEKYPEQRSVTVDVNTRKVAGSTSFDRPGPEQLENTAAFPSSRQAGTGASLSLDSPSAVNGSGHKPNSYEDLVARYGKERVVRFEITNQPEILGVFSQTVAAIGDAVPEIRACELTGSKGQAAPVKDFNAFCGGLSFADIVERNDAENFVKIKVDPSKVAAIAAVGARRMAERIGGPNREEIQKMLERQMRGNFGGERQLPVASDPDYHKKLSELMIDSTNKFAADDAIEELLRIRPEDIQDKEVRKKIARNFRDLATRDGLVSDGKVIRGLVLYGGKFSVPILVELLERERLVAAREIFDGLAEYPDPRGAEAIGKRLGDKFNHDSAVSALRTMGPVAEAALIKAAPSNDSDVSLAAVQLLGEVGTQKSLTLLAKAARSTNPEVAEAAKTSIKEIRERSKTPVAK